MKAENILAVIEELGTIIINYKTEIAVNKYEKEKLKKQLESVEQYLDYYSDNEITESDYKEQLE